MTEVGRLVRHGSLLNAVELLSSSPAVQVGAWLLVLGADSTASSPSARRKRAGVAVMTWAMAAAAQSGS
ncbi:MAG: hypothetical protein ACRDLY_13325, partial [Thermoleophilaceae bacterium]